MTANIGSYSLCAAILVAAMTLLVSLAGVRFSSQELRRTARRGIYLLTGLLSLSSAALLYADITGDFSIEYVWEYTEKALPLGYKIAAFWAGQGGSILLWAWMVAVMATIFVFVNRKKDGDEYTMSAGILALVIGLFSALMMLQGADPFAPAERVLEDGHGMNPMLQNIGMIVHPPILFLGYAAYTIPFALLVGALLTRRLDNWLPQTRLWSLLAWLFLGAGILVGSWWAYVELNFGGYWAWDPVENASLLPWLTGTALLHSLIAHRQRGTFKRWTAAMIATSFLLCIFAAYITRGGVVSSVHGFEKSQVGTAIFATFIVGILFSAGLIAVRWVALKGERPLEGLVGRDGGFMAGNIIFVAMMLFTLLGTLYPVLCEFFGQPRVEISKSFYNKAVLPLGLGMLALMALAPLLVYGKSAANRLLHGVALPLMAAGVVVVALALMGVQEIWALAVGVVASVLLVALITDLISAAWSRFDKLGESAPKAVFRLIDSNHRRYGGHLVHAGVALLVIGIAGSSVYRTESEPKVLRPGESMQVGSFKITAKSVDEIKGPNYAGLQGTLVATSATGQQAELLPQVHWYPKFTDRDGNVQQVSKVSIHPSWRQDLWAVMAADEHGVCSFRVLVFPLMAWIWVGGIVMGLGTIFCLTPRLTRAAEATIVDSAPAPVQKPRQRQAATAARQVA